MCRRREPILLTFRPTVKPASLFLPPLQNYTNYADQEDDSILHCAIFWSYSLCQVSPQRTTGSIRRKQTETSDGCLAGNGQKLAHGKSVISHILLAVYQQRRLSLEDRLESLHKLKDLRQEASVNLRPEASLLVSCDISTKIHNYHGISLFLILDITIFFIYMIVEVMYLLNLAHFCNSGVSVFFHTVVSGRPL